MNFQQGKEAVVFCSEVSFRLAQVCKMVTLVPIQHNSFNILCQGACHQWHLPRVSHAYPSNDLREPSNILQGTTLVNSLSYWTTQHFIEQLLLTRFQPKRQLLPKEILWFSIHLYFPDVAFTTLLSGYIVNLSALKKLLLSSSTPKLKKS